MKVARSRIKGSLVDLNRREVHSDRCRTSIGKPHFSISHKRHDEATRERSIKYHRAKLILDRRETLANAKSGRSVLGYTAHHRSRFKPDITKRRTKLLWSSTARATQVRRSRQHPKTLEQPDPPR
jgi:hypothetical protein